MGIENLGSTDSNIVPEEQRDAFREAEQTAQAYEMLADDKNTKQKFIEIG